MPAPDIYHENVKQALLRDGWNILKEHYELKYRGDRLYPDLAAEKSIVAERGTQKILVEIKSFLGRSFIADLQVAIGQYVMYRNVIQAQGLEFKLYLAIAEEVYNKKFQIPLAQLIVEENQVNLLVFSVDQEVVSQWISSMSIEN
jgi:XisH protein